MNAVRKLLLHVYADQHCAAELYHEVYSVPKVGLRDEVL
jgi:hypothetical protein